MTTKIQQYKIIAKKDGLLHVSDSATKLIDVDQAVLVARERIADQPFESMITIIVNNRNYLTGIVEVSRGGVHGCAITPRDVLRAVLSCHGSSFILSHNHPSGNPNPSTDDIIFTRAVKKAADTVGFPLLDHIIVGFGTTEHFSFYDSKIGNDIWEFGERF